MPPKVRHLKSGPQNSTISVDRLFAAAFRQPHFIYQKESLLGWRPVGMKTSLRTRNADKSSSKEKPPEFNNSPDVKVQEAPESILIEVVLPDIHEDSLYLEVSGDLLIIKAERTRPGRKTTSNKDDKPMVHRFIKLPVIAQPGGVKARLEGNMLKVIIRKPNVI